VRGHMADLGRVNHQAAGLESRVVAGDAVLGEHRGRRLRGEILSKHKDTKAQRHQERPDQGGFVFSHGVNILSVQRGLP